MADESELDTSESVEIKYAFTPGWTIDNMAEIVNAKVGERFESAEFDIGNATWQIISFPNGHNEDTEGNYMIFLALRDMPNSYSSITVRFTISSPQLFIRFTKIAIYNKRKGLGWNKGSFLLSDLKKQDLDKFDWDVNINILRIIGINDGILYQHPLNYDSENTFKWEVSGKYLESMQNSAAGKVYEMKHIPDSESEYDEDMWTLRVIPNSGQQDGFVDVYLQLFALPPNIWSIRVNYTLSCLETDTSSSYITYFSYSDNYWSWKKNILSVPKFKNLTNTATFVADVEVLNYFDKNGYEVVTMSHIIKLNRKIELLESKINSNECNAFDVDASETDELKMGMQSLEQKMNWFIEKLESNGVLSADESIDKENTDTKHIDEMQSQ